MNKHLPAQAIPQLTDAMVASLEDFLPGGSAASNAAKSAALEQQIHGALKQLEDRLSASSQTLQAPSDYQALAAARQAVQSGLLSLQLQEAGRSGSLAI